MKPSDLVVDGGENQVQYKKEDDPDPLSYCGRVSHEIWERADLICANQAGIHEEWTDFVE